MRFQYHIKECSLPKQEPDVFHILHSLAVRLSLPGLLRYTWKVSLKVQRPYVTIHAVDKGE